MSINQLENQSQELLACEEQQNLYHQALYERLAAQQTLDQEARDALERDVTEEAAALERAAGELHKAARWAADRADELQTRLKEGRNSSQRRVFLRRAPANSVIDLAERRADSFAAGVNFYKIALICIVGSFLGVILEMGWCLLRHGYIESRSGLVYGPFNLLYGVGAVVMTLALYRYRNRSASISFLGGMLVGSVIEYVLSWGQEMLFGSTSWDYSAMPFNLNGRICLLYSVFWGVLGIFWIKSIYPRLARLILRIPNAAGKFFTWALTLFLAFNAVMSLLAVDRWSERVHQEAPTSSVDLFLDQKFPDERMERIYANMVFGAE